MGMPKNSVKDCGQIRRKFHKWLLIIALKWSNMVKILTDNLQEFG